MNHEHHNDTKIDERENGMYPQNTRPFAKTKINDFVNIYIIMLRTCVIQYVNQLTLMVC